MPGMEQLPGLPPRAFAKADPSPDSAFYTQPRFVTHIDDAALAHVTEAYRAAIPDGARVLDLMGSWVSHFPPELTLDATGHGMNAAELAANPRLSAWFVQDLNQDPRLPLEDAGFDAATLCASVQYLQRPVEVFREVARVLRPGAPLVVGFSNRCFPTKAVAVWRALTGDAQAQLVQAYCAAAGFATSTVVRHVPRGSDPIWIVTALAPPLARPQVP